MRQSLIAKPPIELRHFLSIVAAVVAVLYTSCWAPAQCPAQWIPGDGIPGATGIIRASTMWDSDGPGPQPPQLVVAGSFSRIGSTFASQIAAWNGTSWSALGSGVSPNFNTFGGVYALAVMPNGDLVAAGFFGGAGGISANNIARWNGINWSPLGSGLFPSGNIPVVGYALAVLANGDLVAAGSISSAGGTSVNNIARWNGTTWSALGSGLNSVVRALQVLPNNDLIVGGFFSGSGAVQASRIARWNGTNWSALGSGVIGPDPSVLSLALLPSGDVIVGGNFYQAGGISANSIARWNGSIWESMGGTAHPIGTNDGPIHGLATLPSGDVVAVGWSSLRGFASRWNGSTWTVLSQSFTDGGSTSEVSGVRMVTALPNGNIFVGGNFTKVGTFLAPYAAIWNGSGWIPACAGFNSSIEALAAFPNGDIVAGGSFTAAGGQIANHVARLSGTTWTPLGAGMNGNVSALAIMPNGDIVAGGSFYVAGGISAKKIARWNGTAWSSLGTGLMGSNPNDPLSGSVAALAVMPGGDIVAAGSFISAGSTPTNYVARWNGSTWSPLGSGTNATVNALVVAQSGDLIAGGYFTFAGGNEAGFVARWDGASWSPLGIGIFGSGTLNTPQVRALKLMPNGDIIAGGYFDTAGSETVNNIARWNGLEWSRLGIDAFTNVYSIFQFGDDLVVAGQIHLSGAFYGYTLRRLIGDTSWTLRDSANIRAMTALTNGDLAVGGTFSFGSGPVGANFARIACNPCYPNCDSSTTSPILNINDFNCFLNKFASYDLYTNCDNSTSPPILNINDFNCFLNKFAVGCP